MHQGHHRFETRSIVSIPDQFRWRARWTRTESDSRGERDRSVTLACSSGIDLRRVSSANCIAAMTTTFPFALSSSRAKISLSAERVGSRRKSRDILLYTAMTSSRVDRSMGNIDVLCSCRFPGTPIGRTDKGGLWRMRSINYKFNQE